MNIAIIGSGNVGSTLGRRWAEHGHHDVIFGVRDPESPKIQDLIAEIGAHACTDTLPEAVAQAPVVVLTTPWAAAQDAIQAMGDLTGKTLIDCTNPIQPGLAGLSIGHTTCAAEQIAAWAQGAKVVKAFNTTGSKNMSNPQYPGGQLSMFLCGDDVTAKQTAAGLVAELGFDVIDTGALFTARYLEPLAMLWIHMAVKGGWGPDFGFKVLKR
ncbi:NADPH-dependent F420 reductase [Anthocerotibacter panamensis]|uniref:NADPH-dependent F420 reductase n=1 Tax=Anthocerotibacter panamensis TaxID=2857077 RepID=UPI001C407100|nr:NADPH-dependent F420 reductase [Anthocerotibacter panamensis]